jgi:glucose dehydrogenase
VFAADLPKPGVADWPTYARDLHGTRFNPNETIIGPDNVDRLKIKWQFATIDDWPIQVTPTVVGDTVFFGAGAYCYALDSSTGEMKWKFDAGLAGEWLSGFKNRGIRSSCAYADGQVYFGTGLCNVHCLDAATGREVWKTNLENDRLLNAKMGYSPIVYNGKVLVGWTSGMAGIACLDAASGAVRWRFRVTQDVPAEYRTGGGSLWTSAAIDEKQNVVFNVTGSTKGLMPNSMLYTESIVAHDIDSGELLWHYQAHPQSAFDLDFCAHPMVFDAVAPSRMRGDVRACVAAGNKAGIYCWNRHSGELYWKTMLGVASAGGGPRINAMAAAYNKVFAQNSSPGRPPLYVTAALNAFNGDIEWVVPNPNSQTAPIGVANYVLYQGYDVNGKLEALDTRTGRRLWEHPLPSAYRGGVAIANGALYTSNGEPQSWRGGESPYKYSVYCFTIDGK